MLLLLLHEHHLLLLARVLARGHLTVCLLQKLLLVLQLSRLLRRERARSGRGSDQRNGVSGGSWRRTARRRLHVGGVLGSCLLHLALDIAQTARNAFEVVGPALGVLVRLRFEGARLFAQGLLGDHVVVGCAERGEEQSGNTRQRRQGNEKNAMQSSVPQRKKKMQKLANEKDTNAKQIEERGYALQNDEAKESTARTYLQVFP